MCFSHQGILKDNTTWPRLQQKALRLCTPAGEPTCLKLWRQPVLFFGGGGSEAQSLGKPDVKVSTLNVSSFLAIELKKPPCPRGLWEGTWNLSMSIPSVNCYIFISNLWRKTSKGDRFENVEFFAEMSDLRFPSPGRDVHLAQWQAASGFFGMTGTLVEHEVEANAQGPNVHREGIALTWTSCLQNCLAVELGFALRHLEKWNNNQLQQIVGQLHQQSSGQLMNFRRPIARSSHGLLDFFKTVS